MSTRKNPWGRGPDGEERNATQPSLLEDQKNRFDRHAQVVAAQRADTTTHDDRVKQREENRVKWNRQAEGTKTVSGTQISGDLAKSREAAEQSRISNANPAPPRKIDVAVLTAVVTHWRKTSPDGMALYTNYEESDFNRTSLQFAIQWLIAHGHEIDMSLPQAAYERCVARNNLEHRLRRDRDGQVVRRRGEMLSQLPPTLHERYVWSDEAEADAQAEHERAVAAIEAETRKALGMNFAELQATVRSKYKPESPTTA
jgi:hypothetical protein